MHDALPYIATIVSVLSLLVVVGDKLFGGGTALANKFHALDREVSTAIIALERSQSAALEKVRNDVNNRIDEYEKVGTLGFDAIKANIHAMQIGLLEFRAKMSEDLHHYIRKDDYNAGVAGVERDVRALGERLDNRLGQLQDLIVYANPDLSARVIGKGQKQ